MTTEQLLREALRKIKHEAASLADAQVIALEALSHPAAAKDAEDSGEADDDYSYFRECLGDSYTPLIFRKYEGIHPKRVREATAALTGQPWADVIAAFVFDIELRMQRERRFASRIRELSQHTTPPASQPKALVPLTDGQKRELIGNYFSEQWSQDAAALLLHDFASHYGINGLEVKP